MLNKLKQMMQRPQTQPKTEDDRLKAAKRNIYGQSVGLAAFVVIVTVVLLFAATTAWYTNTITAGGLSFKAEAWGFEGSVTVSDEIIEAAPGDTGVVELRVKNKSDLASAIGITISKQYMEETEMQKRIYFYADRSSSINGETVDRIYLNNTRGYSYTLYGRNELILSEQIHTDVLIKWEWVYDVVGYYFMGTVDGTTVTVDEYLRPVEYSYDDATFDDKGNLLTVDGEKDVPTFLSEITENDGYKGKYTVSDGTLMYGGETVEVGELGCYPIDKDNNIWVYFCTKNEIDTNTVWDTMYASTAANDKKSYQARITVTGEQLNQEVVTLDSNADLANAITENSGDIVRLSGNVSLGETISVGKAATDTEEGQVVNAIIDLNGFDLAVTDPSITTLFNVAEGSTLTVYNGDITETEKNSTVAFRTQGGEVTLNEINVTGVDTAIYVEDHKAGGATSTVVVSDCKLETEDYTIRVHGNGSASKTMTQLVVQDSTVISRTYVGILGNGNPDSNATSIQIRNSTVEGYYSAVYHPQKDSVLSAENSTFRGLTALAIKAGDVYIDSCTVESTVTDETYNLIAEPTDKNISQSGYCDTGDAIYVESNYGHPVNITISGDSVIKHTADISKAIRVFPEANHVKIELFGGTYSSDVSEFVGENCTYTESEVEVTEGDNTVTKVVYVVAPDEAEEGEGETESN